MGETAAEEPLTKAEAEAMDNQDLLAALRDASSQEYQAQRTLRAINSVISDRIDVIVRREMLKFPKSGKIVNVSSGNPRDYSVEVCIYLQDAGDYPEVYKWIRQEYPKWGTRHYWDSKIIIVSLPISALNEDTAPPPETAPEEASEGPVRSAVDQMRLLLGAAEPHGEVVPNMLFAQAAVYTAIRKASPGIEDEVNICASREEMSIVGDSFATVVSVVSGLGKRHDLSALREAILEHCPERWSPDEIELTADSATPPIHSLRFLVTNKHLELILADS